MQSEPDLSDRRPHSRTKRAATVKLAAAAASWLTYAVQLEQSAQYPAGGAPPWVNLTVQTVRFCTGFAALAEAVKRRSG